METLGQESRRNSRFFLQGTWEGSALERVVVAGMCRASCLRSSQVCRPFASSTVQQITIKLAFFPLAI